MQITFFRTFSNELLRNLTVILWMEGILTYNLFSLDERYLNQGRSIHRKCYCGKAYCYESDEKEIIQSFKQIFNKCINRFLHT